MNFGNIKKFIMIGGQRPFVEISDYIQSRGIAVQVITGKRLLYEVLGNQTMEEMLIERHIPFICIENINEYEELDKFINHQTVGISMGSPWIFSPKVIEQFENKLFNIHPVNIPQMDGAAHFSWQIMMGNKMGATVVQMVREKLNRGEIIATNEYSFSRNARLPIDYFNESAENIIATGKWVVDQILEGSEFHLKPLDLRFRTFYPRLYTDIHGFINWETEGNQLERFISAFDDPYNGASTYLNNQRVRIKDCSYEGSYGSFHPFMAGIVMKKTSNELIVCCNNGALVIRKVLDNEGNSMLHKVPLGSRFFTPRAYIEKAFGYVAEYGADGIVKED